MNTNVCPGCDNQVWDGLTIVTWTDAHPIARVLRFHTYTCLAGWALDETNRGAGGTVRHAAGVDGEAD